jgi:hypothetical protein
VADDASEAKARVLGDDREMLIARDLADADDRDRVRRQDESSIARGRR